MRQVKEINRIVERIHIRLDDVIDSLHDRGNVDDMYEITGQLSEIRSLLDKLVELED